MSRLARVIVPGFPHHVTQRGNRRAPVFFEESDYALYRDLLATRCRKAGVECWAYCFMPNHVHLIMVPHMAEALARALGETHRQYTGFVNARALDRAPVSGPLRLVGAGRGTPDAGGTLCA
jgi:putative transposase